MKTYQARGTVMHVPERPARDPEEVRRLIEIYPPSWRRWCDGPFRGGCGCAGCVLWPAPSTVNRDPEGTPFPNPDDQLTREEVETYLASQSHGGSDG